MLTAADSFIERNGTMFQIVAGAVFVVITAFVSWYFGSRNRNTKSIDYRIVSDIPIVASTERPNTLKIMLGSVEVHNPFITQIRFVNTGKSVIEGTDFLEPLKVTRSDAKVIDFNTVAESEESLVPFIDNLISIEGQTTVPATIQVTPTTLNPGDWFDLQIIYDGEPTSELRITSRIKGRTRQTREIPDRSKFVTPFWNTAGSLIAIGAGVISGFAVASNDALSVIPTSTIVAFVGAMCATTATFFVVYQNRRRD